MGLISEAIPKDIPDKNKYKLTYSPFVWALTSYLSNRKKKIKKSNKKNVVNDSVASILAYKIKPG